MKDNELLFDRKSHRSRYRASSCQLHLRFYIAPPAVEMGTKVSKWHLRIFQAVFGHRKIHRNSIKITVDLW